MERRVLAAVGVLGLAPVVACGLWTAVAHVAGAQGEVSAPRLIGAAVAAALVGVLPLAFDGTPRRAPGGSRFRTRSFVWGSVLVVSMVSALALAPERRWLATTLLLTVGIASGWAFRSLVHRVPRTIDGWARVRPVLAVLWLLTALLAVTQSYRMSVFMTDPAETGYSVMPGLELAERHSCLTAYFQAACLARVGHDNIYDFDSAPELAELADISPFLQDPYQYLPPFLLLPRMLLGITSDFTLLRAQWYVLNVLVTALCWMVAAGWVGGRARQWMIGLLPLFWISFPIQINLQSGNFHLMLAMGAIVAMIAFDRGRFATGGSLLAFTTLSKISPGILGIVLLGRRELRAVGWTAAFGLLLVLAVFPVLGPAPWEAFIHYDLPRLQSGEAFSFLDASLDEITINFSPFGLPFKLRELGVDVGWAEARIVGNLYTFLLIVVAVIAAVRLRATVNRSHQLSVWLALLTLAALRSPFAPPNVFIGLVWLLVLLAAEAERRWQMACVAALWILLTLWWPMEGVIPAITLSLVRQAILLGGLTWLALRAPVGTADPRDMPA